MNGRPGTIPSADGLRIDDYTGHDVLPGLYVPHLAKSSIVRFVHFNQATVPLVADSGCDGKELAPEDSCSVRVRFLPAVAGVLAGTLVIDRDQGDPLQVSLSGTASLL